MCNSLMLANKYPEVDCYYRQAQVTINKRLIKSTAVLYLVWRNMTVSFSKKKTIKFYLLSHNTLECVVHLFDVANFTNANRWKKCNVIGVQAFHHHAHTVFIKISKRLMDKWIWSKDR